MAFFSSAWASLVSWPSWPTWASNRLDKIGNMPCTKALCTKERQQKTHSRVLSLQQKGVERQSHAGESISSLRLYSIRSYCPYLLHRSVPPNRSIKLPLTRDKDSNMRSRIPLLYEYIVVVSDTNVCLLPTCFFLNSKSCEAENFHLPLRAETIRIPKAPWNLNRKRPPAVNVDCKKKNPMKPLADGCQAPKLGHIPPK